MTIDKHFIKSLLIYGALLLFAALFLIPVVVMIFGAMKSPAELIYILRPPMGFHLPNIQVAINVIGRGFLNSLILLVVAVPLSVLVGALGAYPLSQIRFKGDTVVFFFLLFGLFIPYQIVLIPLVSLMTNLNLYDSFPGLWLVHTAYGIPVCTFFLRNYFSTIPKDLLESALIDGLSYPGFFFRILLPLAKPGLAALIILQTRYVWNEYLFALTLTGSELVRPITVTLATFVSQTEVQYGPLMAATIISILPTIGIFLAFKKQFIQGILSGSLD